MSSLETNTSYTSQRTSNLKAHITTGQLWGRVLYKESKPLIPLLLSLAVLSLLGHFLVEIQRVFNSLDVMFHAIPYALNPILFALGAAALLVSQEKEQKTLLWYSSLPIAPRTIVQSKIIVGLVGIALSWLISVCIALPFSTDVLRVRAEATTDILFVLPMTAFFIFGVTFGLAWIFGAAIPALLSLIPVVLLTILTASVITSFNDSDLYVTRDVYMSATPIIWLMSYLFALLAVGLIAWRTGSRSFVAPGGRSIKRTISSVLSYRPESNFLNYKQTGETGALLWQAWMQNRTMIVAMIVTALASWFFVANADDGLTAAVTSFSVGSYALLVCWVGTMAFGADQHLRRVHFLAERGISPVRVWISRLAVPFGILVLLVLTVLTIELFNDRGYERPPQTTLLSCAVAGLWSFVAVAIAQWWGQLGFSRVVSLCGAPLSVVLLIAYYASIVSMFVAPIWLVLLMLPLPFLATRLSMRAWMDRRFTVSYYVRHGLFLVAAVVVPLIPFGFQIATVPRMSSENYQVYLSEYQNDGSNAQGQAYFTEFGWVAAWKFEPKGMPFQIATPSYDELTKQSPANATSAEGINTETDSVPSPAMNAAADPAFEESDLGAGSEGDYIGMGGYAPNAPDLEALQRQFRLNVLKGMPPLVDVMDELVTKFDTTLNNVPGPLRHSPAVDQVAIATLQTTYAVSLTPDSEDLKKRWERSVTLLGRIAARLRESLTLLDQNHADAVEKSLLQILQTATAKQSLDKALYSSLARQLGDSQSRRMARKRAVLHSFQYDTHERRQKTDSAEFLQQLGGISLYGFRNDTILKQTLLAKPLRGYVVDLLIQLTASQDASRRQALVTQLDNTLSPSISKRLIGDWHGDWEKQAETLAQTN
ncbi:MAG: hypothetical protein ACK506_21055 [Pirellula sp.]